MADKDMNNNQLNNHVNDLDDYKIEVADKQGFFATLLNKLKKNKDQKYLNSADLPKAKTTGRSISSLWGMGSIRESLFGTFQNIQKSISEKIFPNTPQNTLAAQVVRADALEQENNYTKTQTDQIDRISPIIPVVKQSAPKGIINNSKTAEDVRLETASLDTSAINEQEKAETEEKVTNIKENKTTFTKINTQKIDTPSTEEKTDSFDGR